MPIITKHGSIFDSTADVLVCPANCVGIMGKGLAKEFKRHWGKDAVKHYQHLCWAVGAHPGKAYYLREQNALIATTKDHWCDPSTVKWVESCIVNIRGLAKHYGWPSIAIPQLGCGCGGLAWTDVEPLIHQHLGDLPATVEVWIYE